MMGENIDFTSVAASSSQRAAITLPVETGSLQPNEILPLLRAAAEQFDGETPIPICENTTLNLHLILEPAGSGEDNAGSAVYSLRHGSRQLFCWQQALAKPLEKTLPYFSSRLATQWAKAIGIFQAQM